MKAIAESLYERGQHGIKYVRRRIPTAIRAAYPAHQSHVVRSLGTADLREAKSRWRVEVARIEAEFAHKRQQLTVERASVATRRISELTEDELKGIARFWVRQVLLTDEDARQRGLDDNAFHALGNQLLTQRAELGKMLAQGNTLGIFPALHGFLYLCGLDFRPGEDQVKRACYVFLSAAVAALDHQLARQHGTLVETDSVAPNTPHPLHVVVPSTMPSNLQPVTWEKVFLTWRDYVPDRPKPTTIAAQTPWRDLQRFATSKGIKNPAELTPELMTGFVDSMHERGLAVDTINERLAKVRAIYKIAVGKHVLSVNPAANTLGLKESGVGKRRKRRLPFDANDLSLIFGSEVFTQHQRSKGQAGEASYWIPLLMYYTGARPEEVAGLALSDFKHDPQRGWLLNIVDRPTTEDRDLFDEVPVTHRRTLKNLPSVRCVPVATQLIDLGLLRYMEWLRNRGETVLFPTLRKDWHGKLSGSFSKFFGRYKRAVGIKDPRKVLYSLRHTMKDLLEQALMPTKYLKRFLGHTTGDGAATDGYGSDLPAEHMVSYFAQIKFPKIPALPWRPGTSYVRLKGNE